MDFKRPFFEINGTFNVTNPDVCPITGYQILRFPKGGLENIFTSEGEGVNLVIENNTMRFYFPPFYSSGKE